jgi:GntR family transcriptional repressor for pyruvate dehydrogenase complex
LSHAFEPVYRQSLSDDIAQRITQLIQGGGYEPGSRLPTISRMAQEFGVGAPTLREALKKLETVGVVAIRHGSGVYVGRAPTSLLMSNPIMEVAPSRKLLVDLIEARLPVETTTASLAARNATDAHLDEMERLLDKARMSLDDPAILTEINLDFHRQIAVASGNVVLHQILDVLSSLFRREQRMILDIHGRRDDDYAEHRQIYEALRARDVTLATARMQQHLERVRDVLLKYEGPVDS